MEEKRPGQHPEDERPLTDVAAVNRRTPLSTAPLTDKERQLIREAAERSERDREELRAGGFGDHQGMDGS